MTIQTSVQQHVAQPDLKEDLLASHSADQSMAPQQQQRSLAEGLRVAKGEQDKNIAASTPAVGGGGVMIGAVLVIVGVFVAGFMRKPAERAVRRLSRRVVDSTVEIKVPILLPVAVMEVVRETLSERRRMSPLSGR
ncbi:MAG TPA: hypothetical protein VF510_13390 [Ktedonobacterales bacterium]